MIACSADNLSCPELQEKLREVGFDAHLEAPLTTAKVNETIVKLIK